MSEIKLFQREVNKLACKAGEEFAGKLIKHLSNEAIQKFKDAEVKISKDGFDETYVNIVMKTETACKEIWGDKLSQDEFTNLLVGSLNKAKEKQGIKTYEDDTADFEYIGYFEYGIAEKIRVIKLEGRKDINTTPIKDIKL